MIRKSRLQKLLKTDNTIYACKDGQCYDLILNKTMFIRENKLVELVEYGNNVKEVEWDLVYLFEYEPCFTDKWLLRINDAIDKYLKINKKSDQ